MIIVSRKGVHLIPLHSCIPPVKGNKKPQPLVNNMFLDVAFGNVRKNTTILHVPNSMQSQEGGLVTHFIADGIESTGPMNNLTTLMNGNPNLHTITWRNISVEFSSTNVCVHRFRCLTIWSCTISLHNLQDLLTVATNLQVFILGGWTSIARADDDMNMEATLCSTLEHLHVNLTDTRYEDSDWLNSEDAREAQHSLARFFDQAQVIAPSHLCEVAIKLLVKDMDVAVCLIQHALGTMECLIIAYVDTLMSTAFINLDGGQNIWKVHVKCVASCLHEVIYSLRMISSLQLVDIQLLIKVYGQRDKLHALSSFDANVYKGQFSSLIIFSVHINPWSTYSDVYGYNKYFRKEVMATAPYMQETNRLKYYWVPDEEDVLTDVFLLNTKLDCTVEALSDNDYT
ncbi:hypothetical protein EDD18DRAFT_1352808 [Armillaria luteobubalina]|uniref:Uncharacterized protein n=1 Tax=Armillaria luteobubalina TaxID=153913 RepID=A0AA39Q864_9AGAR|nr:hypothetical protein EDD18DRAFT_1352808 [Armillaria luteobubalina]